MSSFGQWYEEKKAEENGESPRSSWFSSSDAGGGDMLPFFSSESMQNMSWANMKASMESQMPKKIMGMGYQQRFKVRE